MFFVSTRSVSTWVAILKKAGLILWIHPKGRYRTIWAKTHPKVKTATTLLYMGQKISKEAVISGHAKKLLRQICPEGIDKNDEVTATKRAVQVRQNCLHTNNITKKDTNINTTATPSPPPCKGASALLAVRKDSTGEREKEAETTDDGGHCFAEATQCKAETKEDG